MAFPESNEKVEMEERGREDVDQTDVERELEDLAQTLDKIQISCLAPHMSEHRPKVDKSECPASYSENSAKENLLLHMAENFRTQYIFLFPERKPLLLCPVNEFGVQKFVSTTVRCTLIPYCELYDWQGCASLVTDYLMLEQLDCPTKVPEQLCSPTWVAKTRRGTCFEFSTLLCSLLLGAGYNAYCVSGYAVKEMCLLDLSNQKCPLLELKDTVVEKPSEPKEDVKTYSVETEVKSMFMQHQEEKKERERQKLLAKQQEAERLKEIQNRLRGRQVHSWVLVLAGKRDIIDNFFIDPLSGQSYPTSSEFFIGIESVWNHENYWVNMQDSCSGCSEMAFDLQDLRNWESFSPSNNSDADANVEENKEPNDEKEEELKPFEMPHSWVTQIHIPVDDFRSRFPGGSKVIRYRKATMEKFSPYLLNDGLVTRLTTYNDLECTQVNTVKEFFENRHDGLLERELNKATNVTTERFSRGRSFGLKTHRYVILVPETECLMEFYSTARNDSLVSRVVTQTEMIETFNDHPDFLYTRHVFYEPVELAKMHGAERPIEKVVMKFHRNQSKPACKDVAELVFQISQRKIEVTYHLNDSTIIPDFAIFEKPANSYTTFTDKMVYSFQKDPFQKPLKQDLCQMLITLMKQEKETLNTIDATRRDVKNILKERKEEESAIMLNISFDDMSRNEKANLLVEKLKQEAQAKRMNREYEHVDVLAPFLAQLEDPECLTKEQAVQMHANCLAHLKQTIIDKANAIKEQFDKEKQKLLKRQQLYQKNQLNMTKEDEEAHSAYCSEATIKMMDLKLQHCRLKDRAAHKYRVMDIKLRIDPRLSQHLGRDTN